MTWYLNDLSFGGHVRYLFAHSCFLMHYIFFGFWTEFPYLFNKVTHLKNSKKDKKAFVFANGPSLLQIDPHKIHKLCESGDYDVFGVNSYVSSDFGKVAKPTMYVLSDPAHFGFGTIDGSFKRCNECRSDVESLRNLKGVTLFVPFQFRNKIDNVSINVVTFCDKESVFFKNFSDIRWPRGFCSMTAFKALQIACYLGYKEIFIAGFDNSNFKNISVDEKNQMWETDTHFYDCDGIKRKVCPPAYLAVNMAEYLVSNAMLFKDLYGFSRAQISNLIKDSLVDAFPKECSLDVYVDNKIIT